MRSGFNPPVRSSEVPLQFPRAPCVCGRDRVRERPREGTKSLGSGYRPARPPPRTAECTARSGERRGPFKSRAQAGPGAAGAQSEARRGGVGSRRKSFLPTPAPRAAAAAHSSPRPEAGPAAAARARARAGPGRQFRFGGRGAAAWAGPAPEQER